MADQKMTEAERQEFLAGLHVGMVGLERADGPPLVLPIWYAYEPGGDVEFVTGQASLKGRLAIRFILIAQSMGLSPNLKIPEWE